jgi:hypothetical protein
MAPVESELLQARLARMKQLVESLEHECLDSVEQRALFLSLKQEMEAAHLALQLVKAVKPPSR